MPSPTQGCGGHSARRPLATPDLAGSRSSFEILRALAYEDMSAAWGLFICGTSNGFVGARLSDAGRAEVFAAGGVPIAGVFNPGGSGAPAADGGLVVSGRWPFASGVTYAQWVLANVIVLDDAGAPKPGIGGLPDIQMVVVRHDDVTVIDDWHVAGLRGTGLDDVHDGGRDRACVEVLLILRPGLDR